jgi:hypothetical protein
MSIPPAGYACTDIALTPDQTRQAIVLLTDVHAVLDHLYLDGTDPELTAAAEAYLHGAASDHTLPSLIDAVGHLVNQLTWAMRDALTPIDPPSEQPHPTGF